MNTIVVRNKETNTFPSVIHSNGRSKIPGKPFYGSWPMFEKLAATISDIRPLRDDLTIVTWKGGKYRDKVTVLENSCKQFGVGLTVLPWPNLGNFWEESKAKHYETLNAIKTGLIKTKYVMLFDCGDVIFLKHPNDILEDYFKYYSDYQSVWCTEANDWPHDKLPKYVHHPVLDENLALVKQHDKENAKISRFAYINAGCTIAVTEGLVEFFELGMKMFKDVNTNDQAMSRVCQYLLRDRHASDVSCKIFQCLYDAGVETFEVVK